MRNGDNLTHLKLYIAGSILLHVVVIGVLLALSSYSSQVVSPPVIKASLVKLGKKRDEKLLPRIAEPEPEIVSTQEEAKHEDAMQAPKEPEKKPERVAEKIEAKKESKVEKKVDRKKRIDEILQKTKQQVGDSLRRDKMKRAAKQIEEGLEEGSEFGNEINGTLQASYDNQIRALIQNSYELPRSLSQSELKKLHVIVRVYISADGRLTNVKIEKPSKNPIFDNAVLVGVRSIGRYPKPPVTLRAVYGRKGREIEFCPLRCQ